MKRNQRLYTKIAKANKETTGWFNGPCSDETKSKISFANSGDKHWTNFKSVSDDTKLKLSIAMKGKYIGELNNQAKSITIDGIFFKTYKDAIEYLKISRNEFNRKILPKFISRNKVI